MIGLVEFGKHTGLSPAMLSKIERGRLFPTLPTLLRIALVFGVGLEFFFAGAREKPVVAVVRKRERVRLPERPQARDSAFHFESLDFPRGRAPVQHLLRGVPAAGAGEAAAAQPPVGGVHLRAAGDAVPAHRRGRTSPGPGGDSVYFDSSVPHTYSRSGGAACRAIVVATV